MELDIKEYTNNNNHIDLEKVIKDLEYKNGEHLIKLYSKTAYAAAKLLETEMGSTQFRKFYDKILELNEKASRYSNNNEFKTKILPFISLLYSKVNYSIQRNVAGKNFQKIMFKSLEKIDSQEKLKNFKLFLEAVIGFMPKNKKKGKK